MTQARKKCLDHALARPLEEFANTVHSALLNIPDSLRKPAHDPNRTGGMGHRADKHEKPYSKYLYRLRPGAPIRNSRRKSALYQDSFAFRRWFQGLPDLPVIEATGHTILFHVQTLIKYPKASIRVIILMLMSCPDEGIHFHRKWRRRKISLPAPTESV
jgi:hypothetical protein